MTEEVVCKRDFSRKLLLAVAGFAAVAVPVMSGLLQATQSRAEFQASNTATVPVYEVASIRPRKFGSGGMTSWDFRPDGFTARNITLQMLIRMAYGVEDYDTYPNGMKDLEGHGHGDIMRFGTGILTGQGAPITFLVRMLSQQQLGHPVLDKTGLKNNYDFTLQWTPQENRTPTVGQQGTENTPPPESSGPSIFTAIQEQLGLRLEPQKGPAEVLVIDHVERPSEN